METDASRKQQQHPLPWLNLMVTEPFYFFHFLLFFSYFVARTSLSPDLHPRLLRREVQAVLIFVVNAAVKIVREESWEGFIADTFFYAKGFLLAVALFISHHLVLCYVVAFLVIHVLAQQPAYSELGDTKQLTPLKLEILLTEENTSKFWLNSKLYAPRHVSAQVALCLISQSYLGHFPNAAEKFGISLGVTSSQLPTYILFDQGLEIARLPEISKEGSGPTPTITKSLLCRYFDLDHRLIEYVSGGK